MGVFTEVFLFTVTFCHLAQSRIEFSAAEKQWLLDKHNELRSKVSPSAADMSTLEWDDELEELSTKWAENCIFRHGLLTNSLNNDLGQNMYAGSDKTGHDAMEMWHDSERPDYDFDTSSCRSGKTCGHYTQVVWATSRKVGCGIAECEGVYPYYIICDYFPRGNYANTYPYQKGAPCSKCTKDSGEYCSNNLCSYNKSSGNRNLNLLWIQAILGLVVYFVK